MPQNESRVSSQPRLLLDTSNVIYEMADDIVPKIDEKTGTQKLDRETGLPMWTAPMFGRGRAKDRKWSSQLNVTIVSAEKPAAEDGDQVLPLDLEALPWVSEQNGRLCCVAGSVVMLSSVGQGSDRFGEFGERCDVVDEAIGAGPRLDQFSFASPISTD